MNIVEKYGGTSVGTIEQIQAIAQHAKAMKEKGHNLVIVASAMGKTTNTLTKPKISSNNVRSSSSLYLSSLLFDFFILSIPLIVINLL